MPGLTQPFDPGDQLGSDLSGCIHGVVFALDERRVESVNRPDGRADARAIIQSQQIQWTGGAFAVGRDHDRGGSGRTVRVVAG